MSIRNLNAAFPLLSKARNLPIRPNLTQQRSVCWCVAKPSVMQLPRLGIKSVQGIFLEFVNEIARQSPKQNEAWKKRKSAIHECHRILFCFLCRMLYNDLFWLFQSHFQSYLCHQQKSNISLDLKKETAAWLGRLSASRMAPLRRCANACRWSMAIAFSTNAIAFSWSWRASW